MSSKKEFYASLTEEQRQFIDYLLDESYVKGYNDGRLDERAVTYYERYKKKRHSYYKGF